MSGWGAIYNNTTQALQQQAAKLARLQEQAATGSRVIRASDDPGDAGRILHLKNQSLSLGSYTENLANVVRSMEQSESILQNISAQLTRVRELISQASSDTYSSGNRAAIAEEMDSILEQIVSLANTKSLGRYLFSGSNATAAPYAVQRTDGRITAIKYQGSLQDIPAPVAPGVEYSAVLAGDRIFRSPAPWHPAVLGNTGARAGEGPSRLAGNVTLSLTHSLSALAGEAHGLTMGSDSAAGDTILGQHTFSLDIPNRTLRLDGGPAVAFTGSEANLQVVNGAGDIVHLDLTGVDLDDEFAGDIAVAGTALASIDGGLTQVALDAFDQTSVELRDPATGSILYLDATGIARTGQDQVRPPGNDGYDLFGSIINVRDLLLNSQNLPSDVQAAMLDRTTTTVERAVEGLTRAMTSLGGRLGAMDTLQTSLATLKYSADDEAAALSQADIVAIAADIAQTQTLYQMTLAVSAKLMNMSLLDFL